MTLFIVDKLDNNSMQITPLKPPFTDDVDGRFECFKF